MSGGIPIVGPRAELEGILREQGATPLEQLIGMAAAGEALDQGEEVEAPDPKREALEQRARAYEASGRLQAVALGARRVTLEEERRAVEEHAERERNAPITLAKAALLTVVEATTPAGRVAAFHEALDAIDEACEDAYRKGAADARAEAERRFAAAEAELCALRPLNPNAARFELVKSALAGCGDSFSNAMCNDESDIERAKRHAGGIVLLADAVLAQLMRGSAS